MYISTVFHSCQEYCHHMLMWNVLGQWTSLLMCSAIADRSQSHLDSVM